jgi:hypothetical protein
VILSFLLVVAAELVATAMSTGEVPGMPGSDRTPRSLNKKRRSMTDASCLLSVWN